MKNFINAFMILLFLLLFIESVIASIGHFSMFSNEDVMVFIGLAVFILSDQIKEKKIK